MSSSGCEKEVGEVEGGGDWKEVHQRAGAKKKRTALMLGIGLTGYGVDRKSGHPGDRRGVESQVDPRQIVVESSIESRAAMVECSRAK